MFINEYFLISDWTIEEDYQKILWRKPDKHEEPLQNRQQTPIQ